MEIAGIEARKNLYETATRIRERKPWEEFWEMDLIGIQEEGKKPVFFNLLGKEGNGCGIVVYEGYEGLNDFFFCWRKTD